MSTGASAYGSSLPKEIKPTSLRQKDCKVKRRGENGKDLGMSELFNPAVPDTGSPPTLLSAV